MGFYWERFDICDVDDEWLCIDNITGDSRMFSSEAEAREFCMVIQLKELDDRTRILEEALREREKSDGLL
jgi:predicted mannosyl-3-phosphoglycerate phosphatase (HAD superfamily)